MTATPCGGPGCVNTARSVDRGLCEIHLRQVRRGEPLHPVEHRNRPLAERFWSKVDVRGPEECWEWQGQRRETGYGFLYFDGREQKASRLAYALAFGPIPEGLHVLHHCDNPPCVNARAHLFLGTHVDNMRDRKDKGRYRMAQGTTHGNAKLTADQVLEIRRDYRPRKVTQRELGERYDVTGATIGRVLRGKNWKQIEVSA